MIDINWDEIHEAEAKRELELDQARKEYYERLTEKQEKKDKELQELLSSLGNMVMEEEKGKMEMEQAEEERKALEAVRAKYSKKNGVQEWNASAEDRAWKSMGKALFGEQ